MGRGEALRSQGKLFTNDKGAVGSGAGGVGTMEARVEAQVGGDALPSPPPRGKADRQRQTDCSDQPPVGRSKGGPRGQTDCCCCGRVARPPTPAQPTPIPPTTPLRHDTPQGQLLEAMGQEADSLRALALAVLQQPPPPPPPPPPPLPRGKDDDDGDAGEEGDDALTAPAALLHRQPPPIGGLRVHPKQAAPAVALALAAATATATGSGRSHHPPCHTPFAARVAAEKRRREEAGKAKHQQQQPLLLLPLPQRPPGGGGGRGGEEEEEDEGTDETEGTEEEEEEEEMEEEASEEEEEEGGDFDPAELERAFQGEVNEFCRRRAWRAAAVYVTLISQGCVCAPRLTSPRDSTIRRHRARGAGGGGGGRPGRQQQHAAPLQRQQLLGLLLARLLPPRAAPGRRRR